MDGTSGSGSDKMTTGLPVGAEVEVETSDEVEQLHSALENFVRPLNSQQPVFDEPIPECSYRSATEKEILDSSSTSKSKKPSAKKSNRGPNVDNSREKPSDGNLEERQKDENSRGRPRSVNSEERSSAANSRERPRSANSEERLRSENSRGRPRSENSRGRPRSANSEERSSAANSSGRPRSANSEERSSAANSRGRPRSANSEERSSAANSKGRPKTANPRGRPRATNPRGRGRPRAENSRGRPKGVNSGERSEAANSRRSSNAGETSLPSCSVVTQEKPEILGVYTVYGERRIRVKWRGQNRKQNLTEDQLTEELRILVKNYLQKELEEVQSSILSSSQSTAMKNELAPDSIREFRANQETCFRDTTFFKNVGLDNVEKKVQI